MAAPARNRSAPKKPVNLSIDRDLLQQARELKVNLSKALEERLAEIVRGERAAGKRKTARQSRPTTNSSRNTACSTISESAGSPQFDVHRNPADADR